MGPDRVRRSTPDVGEFLRRRGETHEALPARTTPRRPLPTLPVDDRHAPQRQGGGLPALHGVARRRPVRGPLPRRRAPSRRVGSDAPADQGGVVQVRRQAALPRTPRLHRQVRAFGGGGRALCRSHRLRARGDEPGRAPRRRRRRQAAPECRLRAHDPAAPARVFPGRHPRVAAPPPRAAGSAPDGGAADETGPGGAPCGRDRTARLAGRRRGRNSRNGRRDLRRNRGGGRGGSRPGDGRRHHRRAGGRDRHAGPARSPGPDASPLGRRRQMGPARRHTRPHRS